MEALSKENLEFVHWAEDWVTSTQEVYTKLKVVVEYFRILDS